ncbi:MAG TPA: ABC transporter permease [Bryobacteraceae bacterium]|jgi:putative ABC transport system permease protein|nr:ABC transporter permease [Bryobacteraceae bacterium]
MNVLFAKVESFARDLRYALRSLGKNAGFSVIAVAALALGIGVSTAIYSLARTVVFAPLPFPNASRLVQIHTASRKTGELDNWAWYADVCDWRARNRTLETIGAYTFALLNLPGNPPAALYGASITYNLFPALGVAPRLGRNFLPQEDQPGHGQEIILSDGFWRNRFGADRNMVGKTIRLIGQRDTDQYVVVGVMAAGFNFPMTIPTSVNPPTRQMAYWIPLANRPSRADITYVIPIGLRRPGVSLAQVQNDLSAVAAQLEHEYPDTNSGRTVRVVVLKDQLLGRSKIALMLLLGAIGAVLLITCANLAHLLLSRVLSRTRESGVRLALGASRLRLLQQWMAESLLLSAFGGMGALVVARAALHVMLIVAPQGVPRILETRIDTGALIFAGLASLVAGLIVGNLPAFAAARTDIASALSSAGNRTTAHPGRVRSRDLLIVAEVSLAVVLALGAGLLVKSFLRLTSVDPGFSRDRVAIALVLLEDRNYPDLPSRVAFIHKLLEELKTKPGIISAGAVDGTPLSGNLTGSYVHIEGKPSTERGDNRLVAEIFSASPDYLSTMGIRLLRGRYLDEHDAAARYPVAVINKAAAEAFWPNQNPMGKRISFDNGSAKPVMRSVVGVVADTRDANIDQPVRPALYVPMEQGIAPPQMLVAHVRGDPSSTATAQAIRHAVSAVDKNQPVFLVTSMEDLYNNSIAERRFTTLILTVLGFLALGLAALGVYGVISYSTTQRTREIGIRAALGARRLQIVWLVLSRGMVLSLAGTAIGLTAGLLLTRYLASLLYEVTSNDSSTIAMVALIITGVSLLAGFLPSYRAVRIDPLNALHHD